MRHSAPSFPCHRQCQHDVLQANLAHLGSWLQVRFLSSFSIGFSNGTQPEAEDVAPMNSMIEKRILNQEHCQKAFATLGPVWVTRYSHNTRGWQLSIATYGQPGSNSLSLGGFRIAPANRTDQIGYDNDAEAIGLATGMEGKVFWSRLIKVGGPLGLKNVHRIVGGKCVLQPTADARMGQPNDFELLDFAASCLHDFEATTGILVTTGQDLGHGVMSDGTTQSLDYLHSKFAGSVRANTAMPTGEGNYALLKGMLEGIGTDIHDARIGLIGCGNVGGHVLNRLHRDGAAVFAMDAYAPKREALEAELGIPTWAPERITEFLSCPMDALVVNANGGSLSSDNVTLICQNDRLNVICGCENLAMPDGKDALRLTAAGKLFAPTQLGGMFGYLTAVEEYLCERENRAFDVETIMQAADAMFDVGRKATAQFLKTNATQSFEQALMSLYTERPSVA